VLNQLDNVVVLGFWSELCDLSDHDRRDAVRYQHAPSKSRSISDARFSRWMRLRRIAARQCGSCCIGSHQLTTGLRRCCRSPVELMDLSLAQAN
jgi:hypothetical protein